MLYLEDAEDYSLKLIEAVEQRPLLYDKRNKEYLNCNLKKKIWEEVGQLLVDHPDTWRNMSDDKRQNAGMYMILLIHSLARLSVKPYHGSKLRGSGLVWLLLTSH